jgi:parvulin-like peptidyl-prolyl isomerase
MRGFEDKLMVNSLYEEVVIKRSDISEAELRQYYDKMGTEIKARHILVQTEEIADTVLERLNAGEEFDQMATIYSEDPGSKDIGGDLGWFGRGRMIEPFEEAAFSLKEGEVSEPVSTRFGYHIIRVDSIREAELEPYEEIKEGIRSRLIKQKRDRLASEFLDQMTDRASITIDEGVLDIMAKKVPAEEAESHPFAPPTLPELTEDEANLPFIRFADTTITAGQALESAKSFQRPPSFANKEAVKEYFEGIVVNDLLKLEARRRHLDRRPDVARSVINRKYQLYANELSRVEIEEQVPRRPTEEEMEAFFLANKDQYASAPRAEVSEILVPTLQEAQDIKKQIEEGADFAELARKHSTHSSNRNDGYLGTFVKGRYPEFDLVFGMEAESITDPIEVEDGFAVLKVHKIEPSVQKEFEEVKSRLRIDLIRQAKEVKRSALLEKLKEEMPVTIYEQNLTIAGATPEESAS